MWAEFVIEPELAIAAVEEDGVVAGDVGLAHEFGGWGSGAMGTASAPDGDIGFAFGRTAKPGGEEIAVLQFDDGGSVGGGKGSLGIDEFLSDGGVSGEGEESESEFHGAIRIMA